MMFDTDIFIWNQALIWAQRGNKKAAEKMEKAPIPCPFRQLSYVDECNQYQPWPIAVVQKK